MKRDGVPERGDAIWLTFDPQAGREQAGREQAGRRPAVVLSPHAYNAKTGLAIVCPVTSRVKGYPFEAILPPGLPLQGAVLCDHARNLDWRARKAEFFCTVPPGVMEEITAKLAALLDPAE